MAPPRDIPISPALETYFSARVMRDEDTGCLYWMGRYDRQGYGLGSWHGENYRAHRIAYCLHHQVINLPAGFVPDHLCRVPPCVEWSHLEAVTIAENTRRGRSTEIMRACAALRRARTHCPEGHTLAGENLILQTQKGGIRQRCRICTNASGRINLTRWRFQHKGTRC